MVFKSRSYGFKKTTQVCFNNVLNKIDEHIKFIIELGGDSLNLYSFTQSRQVNYMNTPQGNATDRKSNDSLNWPRKQQRLFSTKTFEEHYQEAESRDNDFEYNKNDELSKEEEPTDVNFITEASLVYHI